MPGRHFLPAFVLVAAVVGSPIGLQAQVSATPTSLSFGNVVIGATSGASSVTLKNGTSSAITISSITPTANFNVKSTTCGSSLGAGKSCKISVNFSPSSLGLVTGTLSIKDTASNSPQTVALSGTGIQPVTLSPASLTFGNIAVGNSSAAQTLTLKNNQSVPLTISSIQPSGDFSQTNSCPFSPSTLAAGGSCNISVKFSATAIGTRTGTISVSDNANNSPQATSLTGTGTMPVSLSPNSLNFGSQPYGTTSAAQTVTLTNNQNIALTINSIQANSDFSVSSTTCPVSPSTVAAGASCGISVKFTPAASGTRNGTLTVVDNAALSPHTSSLTGTGVLSLVAIAVSPSNSSVPVATTQQFTATGKYNDGSTQNITSSVSWSSSAPAVATIDGAGLATALANGTTIISATSGTVTGTTQMNVGAALTSIAVIPPNASIALGTTQQMKAVGTYTDGSTLDITQSVNWSSSATNVATISNALGSQGLATSSGQGQTTLTATLGSIIGSTSLTVTPAVLVSILVTPVNPTVADGRSQQFTATGTFTDASTQNLTNSVSWGSSDNAVATIDNDGLAQTLAAGNTTISATIGSVIGSTVLTVGPAALVSIDVAPANSSIALGTKQQFTATGTYTDGSTQDLTNSVTWNSSGTGVATISNTGLATSIAQGTTTISATSGNTSGATTLTVSAAALVAITVAPANASIPSGTTQQFTAAGRFSDGSTQDVTTTVHWSSSDGTVATVSNTAGSQGLATGLGTGSITVNATSGSVSGSANLTVTAVALVSIAIVPQNPSIVLGASQQFTATGTYTDGTAQDVTTAANWASSNPAVAVISNAQGSQGSAASAGVGTTAISATLGSQTASTNLTVTSAALVNIVVTPATASTQLGGTKQFTATGTYTDGTIRDLTAAVTWTSSNPGIATVSNTAGSQGLCTGTGLGTTTITATSGAMASGATLTVTAAALVAISVSPQNSTVTLGSTQPFTATGTYSDGSLQNLTTSVNWSSSNPGVATVSNTAGSQGLSTGTGLGTTTITATSGAMASGTTLTVTAAALVAISVSPQNPSLPLGNTQQFTATGTYSDGSLQNLTTSVNWSSSNPGVATVSNSLGTQGLATATGLGTAQITANLGGVSASSNVTVASGSQTPRGYLTSPSELANIKSEAAAGTQPYANAVLEVKNFANTGNDSVSSSTANPTYWQWGSAPYSAVTSCTADSPTWMGTSTGGGGGVSTWAKVLVWQLTGDTRYADDAITHLRAAYVTTLANGSTWGGNTYDGSNECLIFISHYVPDYIMAADMLEGYSNWTATDKANMLNWVAGTLFKQTEAASQLMANNWGSAGSATSAMIADYDYQATVVLISRNSTNPSPASAYSDAKQRFIDRVNGNTYMGSNGCTASLSPGGYLGFRPDGGIEPELSRAQQDRLTQAQACGELYLDGPSYPACSGHDNGYQNVHLQGSIAQAELFWRRGDTSLFDHINNDNSGSILRAYLFELHNPNASADSCDAYGLSQRSAYEYAYRYYRNSVLYGELTTSGSGTAANGLGSRYVGSASTRMAHFGTLLAGFAVGENPSAPPTVPPPGM